MKVLIDVETGKIPGAAIPGIGGNGIIHSILDVMHADAPYAVKQPSTRTHPAVTALIPTMPGDFNVFE